MNKLMVLGIAIVLTAVGCGSDSGNEDGSGDGTAAVTTEAADSGVAAVVNGTEIGMREVSKVASNFAGQGFTPPDETQGESYEEKMYYTALNRLVEQELVLQASVKEGLSASEEEIQGNLTQLKAMAGGEERFTQILAQRNITIEDVTRDIRTNLIMKQYLDQAMTDTPEITDADVDAYFQENSDKYGPRPQVRARHILIMTGPEMDDMARAEARGTAEEALRRAKAGEDFGALAQELSGDPTNAQSGGDLGWFQFETMVPPFSEAAFALQPGELSDVVETRFGYHVIKVEERGMTEGQTLDQVRPNIRQVLSQERTQETFQTAIGALRDQAEVTINPPTETVLSAISDG